MKAFTKEIVSDNTERTLLVCYVLSTQSPQRLCMVMVNSENTVKEKGKGSYLEIVP